MERKDFLKSSLGMIGFSAVLMEACKKDVTTTDTTGSDSCIVTPTEEEGPFPYPGGEIDNPLERSDITGEQSGIPVSYTFAVVDTNNSCAIVSGARVDIWHCNKDGYYSGYGNQSGGVSGVSNDYTGQTWLRGYRTTDAKGQVQFTSVYPGWYSPRATHIHLEIFIDNVLRKQAQLAFPESISNVVHVTSLYAAHGVNTQQIHLTACLEIPQLI
jgi:protocatechuate 3,4-dioxygenase beta subunit